MVVGTGIRTAGHLTVEATGWLRRADEVVHLVPDPVAEALIRDWHPNAEHSLRRFYETGRARSESYAAMADFVMARLAEVDVLCLALYGHPGVFASVGHRSIARAREQGAIAWMVPGVSAEDCLFADLGFDPAERGCMSLDATDYLVNDRAADPAANLVLWQIGVVGDLEYRSERDESALAALIEKLTGIYPGSHEVVVYEAATIPTRPPDIQRVALANLADATLGRGSTLFVPPATPIRPDPRYRSLVQWRPA